jgi:hypothetical protein
MQAAHMLRAFAKAGKRAYLLGDFDAGVIVGLGLDGRWCAVLDGEILNRVNPEAISVYSDTSSFMEIEAAGGCPAILRPNTEMSVVVGTQFSRA